MKQPASSLTDKTGTGRNAPFWLAPTGFPLPTSLDLSGFVSLPEEELGRLPELAALFAVIASDSAGSEIRRLRALVPASTYIAVIPDEQPSPAWISRLMELGADDVVEHDDRALQTARNRALRQLQYRREMKAEILETGMHLDFLQACIDTLPSPIFFKNRQGLYTGFNKAFEQMVGMAGQDVLGKSVFDLYDTDLARRYHEADEELMQRGGKQIYEGAVLFADGTRRDVCFNKAVIEGPDGQVRGLAGAVLDISDRKAYETALKESAERDYLTQAYNRRKFFAIAREAERQVMERELTACVGVFDIDYFKMVNDRFGHAAGDEALRAVAQCMMAAFDAPHCVARAGGEEFYILFHGCALEEAQARAEALRKSIARMEIETGSARLSVTISAGVSELRAEADAVSHAISRADRALYRAKHEGRDKVSAA